jgi:peptidyl-prolyl cis-trans isomerase B (cyclophilin B)
MLAVQITEVARFRPFADDTARSNRSMEAYMVRSLWRLQAVLGLALLLPLAGCGSGESGDAVTTSIPGGEGDATAAVSGKAAPVEKATPAVRIETSQGAFTVELDLEHAPISVDNFLSYVEAGHYDQTIFHQVVDGYIALGGGFNTDYSEKLVQPAIRNEAHNGLTNKRGTIAMARQFDVIDSSTSQFFINLGDNTALDHKSRTVEEYGYCVFGHVTEGLDVVEKIAKTPVHDLEGFEMTPKQAVVIKTVRRLR